MEIRENVPLLKAGEVGSKTPAFASRYSALWSVCELVARLNLIGSSPIYVSPPTKVRHSRRSRRSSFRSPNR